MPSTQTYFLLRFSFMDSLKFSRKLTFRLFKKIILWTTEMEVYCADHSLYTFIMERTWKRHNFKNTLKVVIRVSPLGQRLKIQKVIPLKLWKNGDTLVITKAFVFKIFKIYGITYLWRDFRKWYLAILFPLM